MVGRQRKGCVNIGWICPGALSDLVWPVSLCMGSTCVVVAPRSVPTQAPVWSVAWSHRHEQQLILGLDKGRLAVVDLRMTGSRALLLMTAAANSSSAGRGSCGAGSGVTWLPAAAPATVAAAAMGARAQPPPLQPWHSLVALPRDWQQQHAADVGEDWATPEALLACTGESVLQWALGQQHGHNLVPHKWC